MSAAPARWWHSPWLATVVVFLAAFGVSLFFRRPYMWDWDAFGYAANVVTHQRVGLGLGRPGLVAWCVPFWETCRLLLELPVTFAYQTTRLWLMLTAAAGVAGVFWTGRTLWGPAAGWTAALVLGVSQGWSSFASELVPDVAMLAWFYTGLALLLAGARSTPRPGRVLVGALCCGFAATVKETALLLLPALPACWLAVRTPTERLWPSREQLRPSLLALVMLTALLAALLPVGWYVLREGPGYLTHAMNPGARPDFTWTGVFERARFSWHVLTTRPQAACGGMLGLAPVALAASAWLALLLQRQAWQAGGLLLLLLPVVAHWTFGVRHERYYLVALPVAALLTGYAVWRVGGLWRPAWTRGVLCVLVLVWVTGWRFAPAELAYWRDFRWYMQERRELAQRLYDDLPAEAVLLLGYNTPIQIYYRDLGLRPGWRAIPDDWTYPPDPVGALLQRTDHNRLPAYILPKAFLHHGDPAVRQANWQALQQHYDAVPLWSGVAENLNVHRLIPAATEPGGTSPESRS